MSNNKTSSSLRERLSPVYDMANNCLGIDFVANSVVKHYDAKKDDPLEAECEMHIYVDPFEGGKTRPLKSRIKKRLGDYPGLEMEDFQSPRQRNGRPKEPKEDFYSKNPYVARFRYRDDVKEASSSDKEMAQRIAKRIMRGSN